MADLQRRLLLDGLREQGYVEGRNLVKIDVTWPADLPAVFGSVLRARANALCFLPDESMFLNLGKLALHARPADLSVEQPTGFERNIMLKAANSLGITTPQSLLLCADEEIQ